MGHSLSLSLPYREFARTLFAGISRILVLALFFVCKEQKLGREFALTLLAGVGLICFMMVSHMPKKSCVCPKINLANLKDLEEK